jgi:HAD superfamily hydrolase (TIGR01509 family)
MVDVVLLELEGVIFDTREIREASLREAMAAHGLENLTGADEVITDLVALRAARAFSARIAAGGLAMQPGARSLLESAAGSARLAIVTRATRSDVDSMLRLAQIDDLFTVTVCADDASAPKPSPDCYNLALDRLGRQRPVVPGGALALEDCLAGIRAAHAAGTRCIAVGPLAPHRAIEADAFVDTLEGHTLLSLDRLSRPGMEHVQ